MKPDGSINASEAKQKLALAYWRYLRSDPQATLTQDQLVRILGAYLRGCGGHAGVFDDAKPERHRLRQCNTVADPGRRDRDTGAGKISGNVFVEPLTWRHSVQDDK